MKLTPENTPVNFLVHTYIEGAVERQLFVRPKTKKMLQDELKELSQYVHQGYSSIEIAEIIYRIKTRLNE